jgi:hypothetical protein
MPYSVDVKIYRPSCKSCKAVDVKAYMDVADQLTCGVDCGLVPHVSHRT